MITLIILLIKDAKLETVLSVRKQIMSMIGTLNIPNTDEDELVNALGYNGILSDSHKNAIINIAKEKHVYAIFLEGNNDIETDSVNTLIISNKDE